MPKLFIANLRPASFDEKIFNLPRQKISNIFTDHGPIPKTDNNLLLLKTEMNAGHGGKSGRDGAIEEIAIDYAFALKISNKI